MANKRYYTKGIGLEEMGSPSFSSTRISKEEFDVKHQAPAGYFKEAKEELPLTFIVIFSGGTVRESDYFYPILKHRNLFPMLKLEFLADDTFLENKKPRIFDFARSKQREYQSSTTQDVPDKYFLLTDIDDFGIWVTKETPTCEKLGIRILASNPCFEVWLYYATNSDKFNHFLFPQNRLKLSKTVKTWCGSHVKGGLQPRKALFKLDTNIVNAKSNYVYDENTLYGDLFSSNVFELGEILQPLLKGKIDALYK